MYAYLQLENLLNLWSLKSGLCVNKLIVLYLNIELLYHHCRYLLSY